jgi:hypothetical protein
MTGREWTLSPYSGAEDANRADSMSISSSSMGRAMSDEEAQAEQAVQ